MKLLEIVAERLSQFGFEQYGRVIESRGLFKDINDGFSKKWNYMVEPFVFKDSYEGLNFGVLKSRPFNTVVSKMERHNYTSQIFIPMVGKRYLIIVAEDSKIKPIAGQVKAFFTTPNQGVCFHPKIWHCPLNPLEDEMEFVSIMKNSEIPDVELMSFENEIRITVNTEKMRR